MGFFKRKNKKEDEPVWIGTTGYRIKKFRLLRNLSQTELGVKCGLKEVTAESRISQYENNKQIPRDKNFYKVMANALNVNEHAIYDLDMSEDVRVYHLLFELEELFQASPYRVNNVYCLAFGGYPPEDGIPSRLNGFLRDWAQAKEEYAIKEDDSEEVKTYKRHQYEVWKAEYPQPVVIHLSEEGKKQLKIEELQRNMDEIRASLETTQAKVDELKERAKNLGEDDISYQIRKKSDLIGVLMDIMQKGLMFNEFFDRHLVSPVRPVKDEYDDLLSIKLSEIEKSETNTVLYARILAVIDTIMAMNLEIVERTTAYKNEEYVTYSYKKSDRAKLFIPDEIWHDMIAKVIYVNEGGFGYGNVYLQLKEKLLHSLKAEDEAVYTESQE